MEICRIFYVLGVRNRTLSFVTRPYLLVTLILNMSFAGVTIGITVLEQSLTSPRNPFEPYTDIFPGQPAIAAQTHATCCQVVYTHRDTPAQESCTITPTEGIFSSVEIVFSNGIIHRVTFIPRENTLKIGDLIILFGTPSVPTGTQSVYFPPSGRLAAAAVAWIGRADFSHLLNVRKITFTNAHPGGAN